MNDTEKVLWGCAAGITGLGLQFFLSPENHYPLERFPLIFLGISIPIVYYCIKLEILLFIKLYNMIKLKLNNGGKQ